MQKQWKYEGKRRENENVLKIQPETELLLLYLNFGFVLQPQFQSTPAPIVTTLIYLVN